MSNPEQNAGRRPRKRLVLLVLLSVVLLVSMVSIGVGIVALGLPLHYMTNQVRETRQRLLSEVDHEVVRSAARERLAKYEDVVLFSDDPRIPETIRSTNPTWISVCQKTVHIEYGGGFHHQGFVVIPDGDPPPVPTSDRDFQKLLDGIWFYEDK
jgi:hypothetical protein